MPQLLRRDSLLTFSSGETVKVSIDMFETTHCMEAVIVGVFHMEEFEEDGCDEPLWEVRYEDGTTCVVEESQIERYQVN